MPDVEQWRRVRSVLQQALELEPAQRPAYLDQTCAGDPALRAEVEELLAAAGRSALIDHPVEDAMLTVTNVANVPGALLKPGQTFSHYQIVKKIGEGGMGEVYQAIDKHLDRRVALKVLLDTASTHVQKQRFAREAKAASALNHPNIVTIYEFNTAEGIDFIAMEYVDGVTLDRVPRAPLTKVLGYARQAASAVAKAHAAGIVHRDLKPSNIMVASDGVAKILDFGLAKQHETAVSDATQSLTLTKPGGLLGTPAYMSPEQILGEPAGPASDAFAFGVILYELACGHRPFKGKTLVATLDQIAHVDPPIPEQGIPRELASLIRRCLKKSPAERLASFDEIGTALEQLTKRPEPQAAGSRRWILAAALGTLVVTGVGLAVAWRTPSPAPVLDYAIEAQQPGGQPYLASERDTFQGGWKFRLRLTASQTGVGYVVNQGPGANGTQRFWILHRQAVDAGQAALTGWYVFDQNPGTELLWIIWSRQPIPELERTGEVTAPETANRIGAILADLRKADRGGADVATLARQLELRHE